MPLIYTVDHALRRVRQTGFDPLGAIDVFPVQDQQALDGAWTYRTLVDLSRVRWVPTSTDIQQFISRVNAISRRYGLRGPLAMVATDNTALFGMFRMYSVLGEQAGATIEVFTSVEAAEDWLSHLGSHR